MVGFDYVKTRTLAYVQSYDWLPIIVQFSKICTSQTRYYLAPKHFRLKCFTNWRLDYNNMLTIQCQALFIIFFRIL